VGRRSRLWMREEKTGPGKIAGQHKSRGGYQQREPPDDAAPGPEHGARRNGKQQKLGVL
jgi:hypothetical protein